MMQNENRPVGRARDEGRDTSTLMFRDGEQKEFFLRGAVCWPVIRPVNDSIEGCILLAGVECDSGAVYLFEQHSFGSVMPVLDADRRRIAGFGVGPVLSVCWSAYLCRKFFFNHVDGEALNNEVLAGREASIQPKPVCIGVDWPDDATAWARIRQWEPRIVAGPGPLAQQRDEWEAAYKLGGAQMIHFPAVWALACLVTGLERWPWRKGNVARRVAF